MTRYLFGFEVHYLCKICQGAAYDIRRYSYGTYNIPCNACPLCDDHDFYYVPGRYYQRWK